MRIENSWRMRVLLGALALGLGAAPACNAPLRRSQAQSRPPLDLQTQYLAEMEGSSKRIQDRHVWVHASDIELPPTAGSDEAQVEKQYKLYVWASDGESAGSLKDRLGEDLEIEVLGAKATVEAANYDAPAAPGTPPPASEGGAKPFLSRNVATITLNSGDLSQSVTVIAWYRRNYAKFEAERLKRIEHNQCHICRGGVECLHKRDLQLQLEEIISDPNPWGEVRTVRVFNGDLHTKITMLSEPEIIDAFGPNFNKYFFVGRTYFKNRHADKWLVVHTTSMRAKCLFYREPNLGLANYFLNSCNDERFAYAKRYHPLVAGESRAGETRTGIRQVEYRGLLSAVRRHVAKDSSTAGAEVLLADNARMEEDDVFQSARFRPSNAEQKEEADAIVRRAYGLYRDAARRLVTAGVKPFLIKDAIESLESNFEGLSGGLDLKVQSTMAEVGADTVNMIDADWADRVAHTSPVQHAVPVLASPTRKTAAYSPYIFRQGMMASTGYLFDDFYRPMTFATVLNSLWQKTKERPQNRVLDWLQSLGTMAGALVGLDSVANVFGDKTYSDSVAVFNAVFLPEMNKLLRDDIERYVQNLGNFALDEVIRIEPGHTRDGYVFFPKGPIYGFGIDEFTVDCPTFIVNIDNVDVVCDGALVDKSFDIQSGRVDSEALVKEALDRGRALREENDRKQVAMSERLRGMQLVNVQDKILKLLEKGKVTEADLYLASFTVNFGKDPSGTLDELKAKIDAAKGGEPITLAYLPPKETRRVVAVTASAPPSILKPTVSPEATKVRTFVLVEPKDKTAYLEFNAATGSIILTPKPEDAPGAGKTLRFIVAVVAENNRTASSDPFDVLLLQPPSKLVYETVDAVYTLPLASPVRNGPTSSGGTVKKYAIQPEPPEGMSFDTTSGVISGTPSAAQDRKEYTVTATNDADKVEAKITIQVNPEPAPTPPTPGMGG